MKKDLDEITSWIKKNKFLSLIIFIGIIVVGFFSFSVFNTGYGMMGVAESAEYYPAPSIEKISTERVGTLGIEADVNLMETQDYEYQIREGSATIETDNADSDYEKVKKNAEGYGGWVETVNKGENYRQITITTTLKIPAESFDDYVDWLLKNFDVKSSNLRLYRETVQRQQEEIDILTETLEAYDRLLEKAEGMKLSAESLELMQQITQRKLYIMRQLKSYGYSIQQVEERANYAILTLTLKQDKEIELMPEDLWADLMTKVRDAIANITNALLDLVTIPVVIFINLIVWIIYALVVLIPLFVVYKLVMRLFRRLNKKIK